MDLVLSGRATIGGGNVSPPVLPYAPSSLPFCSNSFRKADGVEAILLLLLPVSLPHGPLLLLLVNLALLLVALLPESEVSIGAKLDEELLGSSSGDEGLEPVVEKVEDTEGEPIDPR